LTPSQPLFGAGGFREESMRESLGEGATGNGNFEGAMALNAGVLALYYIGTKSGCEGVNGREGEEIWVAHRCDFCRRFYLMMELIWMIEEEWMNAIVFIVRFV